MDKTNNPLLESWIPVDKESDFPIQNIHSGYSEGKENHLLPPPVSGIL